MKEYQEANDLAENIHLDDVLKELSIQGWTVVPGCYQVIYVPDRGLRSFALMERNNPDPPPVAQTRPLKSWQHPIIEDKQAPDPPPA